MHDAHTHLTDESLLKMMKDRHLPCIVNASTQEEFNFLKEHQYPEMKISCGIHPWYPHEDLKDCFEKADFLGEIGLDKPWCDTPFELQKQNFIHQLETIQKPTILHTKGYEKEVLEIIKNYPRTYIVHWYSCLNYVEEYINLDCYFTVGPSVEVDKAVSELVRKVPLNRLLIETDGLEAVAWALNKKINQEDYFNVLSNLIQSVANIKKLPFHEVNYNLIRNFNAVTCNS